MPAQRQTNPNQQCLTEACRKQRAWLVRAQTSNVYRPHFYCSSATQKRSQHFPRIPREVSVRLSYHATRRTPVHKRRSQHCPRICPLTALRRLTSLLPAGRRRISTSRTASCSCGRSSSASCWRRSQHSRSPATRSLWLPSPASRVCVRTSLVSTSLMSAQQRHQLLYRVVSSRRSRHRRRGRPP